MKSSRLLLAATLLSLLTGAGIAHAGVSVSIGQPGFYGRIDVGGYPAPALVYPEPVLIRTIPAPPPPIYLRVPPRHSEHWGHYCGRYGACGRPVYFVTDQWYHNDYAPQYREHHGHRHYAPPPPPPQRGWDRGPQRGYDNHRGGGWERGTGGDHGHGHGHGHH